MTNQQYLTQQLGKFDVTSEDIDIILLENNLNGDDQVTDTRALRMAVYNQLPGMMASLYDVTEGGFSRKWNYTGLKAWYSWLAGELGLPDKLTPTPTVTGAKPW